MPSGRRLNTEKEAQIGALNRAEFSSRVNSTDAVRIQYLISSYLGNPNGYDKKRDTGCRRTLTICDEKKIADKHPQLLVA
ncbi:hypothetical protein Y032_0551g3320 [Ancylostoma ceylanicum]|uniref:Uncharacterized protein n=1 Tax=Ancylostoma ceylanicum TaxID=53326 RepID=A0A016WQL4_9BILA|nr:hypothetical protein Y032_0551g3320 [Ancylostoma ceylanicum]